MSPDTPLLEAVRLLGENEFEQLPVVEDGQLIGVLGRADILRLYMLQETLGQARLQPVA